MLHTIAPHAFSEQSAHLEIPCNLQHGDVISPDAARQDAAPIPNIEVGQPQRNQLGMLPVAPPRFRSRDAHSVGWGLGLAHPPPYDAGTTRSGSPNSTRSAFDFLK